MGFEAHSTLRASPSIQSIAAAQGRIDADRADVLLAGIDGKRLTYQTVG